MAPLTPAPSPTPRTIPGGAAGNWSRAWGSALSCLTRTTAIAQAAEKAPTDDAPDQSLRPADQPGCGPNRWPVVARGGERVRQAGGLHVIGTETP